MAGDERLRNFVPRRSPLMSGLHWTVSVNSPHSKSTVCTTLCSDTETLNKWFNSISADLSQPGMKRGFGKLPSHMRAAVFYAKDCDCAYKFDKSMANHGHPFSQSLYKILSTIMPLCNIFDERHWPNAAHVNWYQNGYVLSIHLKVILFMTISSRAGLGWHRDDEPLHGSLDQPFSILSLSLGASRTFYIERSEGTVKQFTQMPMDNGVLLAMCGLFQKDFVHK